MNPGNPWPDSPMEREYDSMDEGESQEQEDTGSIQGNSRPPIGPVGTNSAPKAQTAVKSPARPIPDRFTASKPGVEELPDVDYSSLGQSAPKDDDPSFTGFFKNLGNNFVDVAKGLGQLAYYVPDKLIRGGSEWVSYLKGNRDSIGNDFSGQAMDVIRQGMSDNITNIIKATVENYKEYKDPLLKMYNRPLDVLLDVLTVADLGATAVGSYAGNAAKAASLAGNASDMARWARVGELAQKGAVGAFLRPMAESPMLAAARKVPLIDRTLQALKLTPEDVRVTRLLNEELGMTSQGLLNDARDILTSAERVEDGGARRIAQVAYGQLPESALDTPALRQHAELLRKLVDEQTQFKINAGALTEKQAHDAVWVPLRAQQSRLELGQLAQDGKLMPSEVKAFNYLLTSNEADATTQRVINKLDRRGALARALPQEVVDALKSGESPRTTLMAHLAPVSDVMFGPHVLRGGVLDQAKRMGFNPFYLPLIHEKNLSVGDAFLNGSFKNLKASWMKARTGAEGNLMDANVAALAMRQQYRSFQRVQNFFSRLKNEPFVTDITDDLKAGTYEPKPGTVIMSTDGLRSFGQDVFSAQANINKNAQKLLAASGAAGENIEGDFLRGAIRDTVDPRMMENLRASLLQRGNEAHAYEIPRSIGETILGHVGTPSPLAKYLFDTPRDLLRASALYMNPLWYAQHIVGHSLLNMLGGVNPFSYFRAGGKSFAKIVPDELKSTIASALNVGFTQAERMKTGLTSLPPFRQAADAAQAIENWFRNAHFVDKLTSAAVKQGLMTTVEKMFASNDIIAQRLRPLFDAAAQRGQAIPDVLLGLKDASAVRNAVASTNQWLFDYNNLHPLERDILRRVVPFWSFMKNVNLLLLRLPIDRPVLTRAAAQIGEIHRDQLIHTAINSINDDALPDWLEGHVPIGTDKDGNFVFTSIKGLNPFNHFGNLFSLKKLAASTNPIIKATLETISGRDMWTQKNLQSNEPVYDYAGKAYRVRVEGNQTTLVRDIPGEGWISQFASQFPQVKLLRALISPYESTKEGNPVATPFMDEHGNWQYPTNLLDTALRFGGINIKRVDPASLEQRELFEKRNFIKGMAKTLNQAPPEYRSFILDAIQHAAMGGINRKED